LKLTEKKKLFALAQNASKHKKKRNLKQNLCCLNLFGLGFFLQQKKALQIKAFFIFSF